ncbi:MAG TPA: glutaminyl-peptide cyclotransferase [Bryobacteraceae bacterium]|nr:glutaminyl-peptide cyclotransferase [Bryobacteraceae bacterium]
MTTDRFWMWGRLSTCARLLIALVQASYQPAPLRIFLLVTILTTCACNPTPTPQAQAATPIYSYEIVHTYPHDPTAFTEGLFYLDGLLYESTGLEGHSTIRKVRLESGEIVQKIDLPPQFFGEGIINWKDHLIQLTYKTEVGFVYDLANFACLRQFQYKGEGWALTQDGKRILMSDGTPDIRFWDPETLQETGRITVTDQGVPVKNVNELEWIKGEIYANVWTTDRIARIDPASGKVNAWIDLTGLLSDADRAGGEVDVLNGIAYDAKSDRIFVTGKRWPKLFEIRPVTK